VPKSAKYLLIGSPEAYSGKSAIILGLAHQLQAKGLDIAYGKPIGTCWDTSHNDHLDEDVRFIAQTLNLSTNRLLPTLVALDDKTVMQRLKGIDQTHYLPLLQDYVHASVGDLVLLEGAGTLNEGLLFDLSLPQMAHEMDAAVVLVTRFHSGLVVEPLLAAQQQLGDRLLGVLINDVPHAQQEKVETQVKLFLEKHGIEVLATLPQNDILRSVSVGELVYQLNAEILCRADRLDLMVESLKIGAMNVNSALEYFRKGHNMAIVTGGDRTDIQLAALETSTQCLILTGHIPPSLSILSRAEELEIPVLSVDLDTLTTVEIIDRTFGQVRLHEPVKVQAVCHMIAKHFDCDRLLQKLELEPAKAKSESIS
jgi:hypothetical protein